MKGYRYTAERAERSLVRALLDSPVLGPIPRLAVRSRRGGTILEKNGENVKVEFMSEGLVEPGRVWLINCRDTKKK